MIDDALTLSDPSAFTLNVLERARNKDRHRGGSRSEMAQPVSVLSRDVHGTKGHMEEAGE